MEVSEKLHSDDVCKMCEACQFEGLSTNADGLCVDCNDYMCQTCFRHHLKCKTSRNHVLGHLTLGKKETREDRPTTKDCKKHSKEAIKYYCRKHDVVACGDCIVAEHKGCEMGFIKFLCKKLHESNEYKDMMRKIQSLEDENKKNDKQRKINSAKNKSLADKALAEIRNFRKEINDHLDRTEAEILADVSRLSKKNEDLMSELDEKITKINHDIAVWKPIFDASLHEEEILFINLVECRPKYSDIERSVNELKNGNQIASFIFEPDQKMKELLASRWKLGSLNVVTKTEAAEGPIFIPQQRYYPPDPRSAGFDVGKRVAWELEEYGSGTVTGVDPRGYVSVRWTYAPERRHAAGAGGQYELKLIK